VIRLITGIKNMKNVEFYSFKESMCPALFVLEI